MAFIKPEGQISNIIEGLESPDKRIQQTGQGFVAISKKARKKGAKAQSNVDVLQRVDEFILTHLNELQSNDLDQLHAAIQTRTKRLNTKERGFLFRLFASDKSWDKLDAAKDALTRLDQNVLNAQKALSGRVQSAAQGGGALPSMPSVPGAAPGAPPAAPGAPPPPMAPMGGGPPPPPPPPMMMRSSLHSSVMKGAKQEKFKGEPLPPKILDESHDLGKPETIKDKKTYISNIGTYLKKLDETLETVQAGQEQKKAYLARHQDLMGVRERHGENSKWLAAAKEEITEHEKQQAEGNDIFIPETGQKGEPILLQYYSDSKKAVSKEWTVDFLLATEKAASKELATQIAEDKSTIAKEEKQLQAMAKNNLGVDFLKWDSLLKEKALAKKQWQLVLDKLEGKKTSPKTSPRKEAKKITEEPTTSKERLAWYQQKMGMKWASWSGKTTTEALKQNFLTRLKGKTK